MLGSRNIEEIKKRGKLIFSLKDPHVRVVYLGFPVRTTDAGA